MAGNIQELQRKLEQLATELPHNLASIVEVEGLNFIQKNFRDQGFNDNGVEKWKERKTTDKHGRDLTRYRTNRRGRQGELTEFGKREIGRAILTGHQTGGDKLRNSFRARTTTQAVVFYTYKGYAEYHNEGTADLPKRQFMGESKVLNDKIKDKLTKYLDRFFRG